MWQAPLPDAPPLGELFKIFDHLPLSSISPTLPISSQILLAYMIRHNKSKYSLLPAVWHQNQTGSKNVSSTENLWIKMQTVPRLFIFRFKKKKNLSTYFTNYHKTQSGKQEEGMPEEGVNKHWQTKKLFFFMCFQSNCKILSKTCFIFPEKRFKSFPPSSSLLMCLTHCGPTGISCILSVQIYQVRGCVKFKRSCQSSHCKDLSDLDTLLLSAISAMAIDVHMSLEAALRYQWLGNFPGSQSCNKILW